MQSSRGGIIFLSLCFGIFFFPFKDPKNAVPFVERIFQKKGAEWKKIKITQAGRQNIAISLNSFLLPSLTCNFSSIEKKKLVIIGDYSQNPGPLLFQVFSLLGLLLAFIGIIVSGVFFEASGLVIIHTRGMSQIWLEVREKESGRNILDSCLILTTYWNSFIL